MNFFIHEAGRSPEEALIAYDFLRQRDIVPSPAVELLRSQALRKLISQAAGAGGAGRRPERLGGRGR